MARRQIFDSDPDPLELFEELYVQGDRGPKGLPIGNLDGHIRDRLNLSYMVLCLCAFLKDRGRIGAGLSVHPVRAHVQDKTASHEFPAAHVIPCDLDIGAANHKLYDFLFNPFNRTWVRRNVFGKTNRVHRLTNVADRRCEAGPLGLARVLADACEQVLRMAGATRQVFDAVLVPGYVRAAEAALRDFEAQLSNFERTEMGFNAPVDQFGKPLTPRSADTRLGSPDPAAVAANKTILRQVLLEYAALASRISVAALADVEGKVDALMVNERFF